MSHQTIYADWQLYSTTDLPVRPTPPHAAGRLNTAYICRTDTICQAERPASLSGIVDGRQTKGFRAVWMVSKGSFSYEGSSQTRRPALSVRFVRNCYATSRIAPVWYCQVHTLPSEPKGGLCWVQIGRKRRESTKSQLSGFTGKLESERTKAGTPCGIPALVLRLAWLGTLPKLPADAKGVTTTGSRDGETWIYHEIRRSQSPAGSPEGPGPPR